jgi:DNA-directed RNA polymerase specialized sigma24 family protein
LCPNGGRRPHGKGEDWCERGLNVKPGQADDDDRYTADELRAKIEALSDAEVARLMAVAKSFAWRTRLEPADLLQEAYYRVLDERRTCRKSVGVLAFLCQVMRGLRSDELEAHHDGRRPAPVESLHDGVQPLWANGQPSPEQAAISQIMDGKVLAKIEAKIAEDEELGLLIEGQLEKMNGQALQDLLGVDARGLAAVRKRLKRLQATLGPERSAS